MKEDTVAYLLPAGSTSPTLRSISRDRSSALLEYKAASGKSQFLRLPLSSGKEIIEVSKLFNSDFKSVVFAQTDSNSLLALDDKNDLRRLQISDKTMSAPIIQRVKEVLSKTGDIYLVAEDGKEYRLEDDKALPSPVPSASISNCEIINLKSEKTWACAQNGRAFFRVESSKNQGSAIEDILVQKEVGQNAKVQVSPDQKYVLFQGQTSYVYDLEESSWYELVDVDPKSNIGWLDSEHLYKTEASGVKIYDYDGQNLRSIAVQTSATFPALTDRNFEYVYFANASAGSETSLSKIELYINE